MSKLRLAEHGFAPNLFDKLFDDSPRLMSEINPLRRLNIDELKASVAKDLEALFNSRRSFQHQLDDYPLVQASVLNFGILDFVGLSSANPMDCAQICYEIERTISQHDPRLRQVNVSIDLQNGRVNALSFSIQALLVVHPAQEHVTFDAVLQPSSQQYSVQHNQTAMI
ncbi:MAG: type VI secretion system baseplate subunit TssE [Pseudomonadota bacterium]|nr:type VI secretion system baseplate subunit TssE [Pseudomonadota bacterium]